MARPLSQLLQDVNAYVALDSSIPIGTDATTWTNYANQAVQKASGTMPWPQFHTIYQVATSQGPNSIATLASISMPSGFREFEGAPQLDLGNGNFIEYTTINPQERFTKQPQDKYCYVLGNPQAGFTAVFNQLQANATLNFDYQRFPSGFATLTDACELDDDTYVVEQVKSYVLQARSDDRFPSVEQNAQRLLDAMGGRQDRTVPGGVNTTPKLQRYRIGD